MTKISYVDPDKGEWVEIGTATHLGSQPAQSVRHISGRVFMQPRQGAAAFLASLQTPLPGLFMTRTRYHWRRNKRGPRTWQRTTYKRELTHPEALELVERFRRVYGSHQDAPEQ